MWFNEAHCGAMSCSSGEGRLGRLAEGCAVMSIPFCISVGLPFTAPLLDICAERENTVNLSDLIMQLHNWRLRGHSFK